MLTGGMFHEIEKRFVSEMAEKERKGFDVTASRRVFFEKVVPDFFATPRSQAERNEVFESLLSSRTWGTPKELGPLYLSSITDIADQKSFVSFIQFGMEKRLLTDSMMTQLASRYWRKLDIAGISNQFRHWYGDIPLSVYRAWLNDRELNPQ